MYAHTRRHFVKVEGPVRDHLYAIYSYVSHHTRYEKECVYMHLEQAVEERYVCSGKVAGVGNSFTERQKAHV